MKKHLCLLIIALLGFGIARAADFNDLIPRPAYSSQSASMRLTLPKGLKVATAPGLPADMQAEAARFVSELNVSAGLKAKSVNGRNGFINLMLDPALPAEGYRLDITPRGVNIHASTAAGTFYALQTIKKLLPPNVAAGKPAEAAVAYELPVGVIVDEPRYEYRGFMLDVSRHFFTADEIKKMLDLMAVYKLNRFHWHLTDDQGWRLPIAKYPRLTQEGATNRNILRSDFDQQKQWREGDDTLYGPFAYTTDEVRDIVAYAKERHIEVIPEIDMPGHMVAAIHAYPEFSVDPESKHYDPSHGDFKDFNHEIWNKGGVSRDVLDVSNPAVMQFVKDVVDELAELFPYEYIHIGGDECPTVAWEVSPSCKAKMQELSLDNVRALQSWFTKEIANYARTQHGRKVMGWNELITEGNVDMDMIKDIDPVIFCWIGGEQKAEANGLRHVYTPFNGGYYINRSYAGHDRIGAVGDGALAVSINVNPPMHENCIGVQGTFWTEQVDRPEDMEYLALPRLIGVAEQGWSSEINKDYEDFLDRLILDEEYLRLGGYNYGRHQLVKPTYRKPEAGKWYTVTSRAGGERAGKVMEVLAEGSPVIAERAANGAAAGRLWGCEPSGSAAQQFRFVEDPANPGRYAIVNKAQPGGSVCSAPVNGRWTYLPDTVDYGFILDKSNYGDRPDGTFYYAIRPANASGSYLNFSRNAHGLAINVYSNPQDGNGGLLVLIPAE